MKFYSTFFAALLLALLAGGCASSVDPNEPPEIVYGEDLCDRCGMIISDERFAAGLVIENAPRQFEHRIFDDIGGMVAYAQEHEGGTIVSYFVHDYLSKEWLDAREAFFVVTRELHTPMGFGIAAFAERSAAEVEFADHESEIVDFETLIQRPVQTLPMEHSHISP